MTEVGQLLKPVKRSCDGADQSEREGILDLKAAEHGVGCVRGWREWAQWKYE